MGRSFRIEQRIVYWFAVFFFLSCCLAVLLSCCLAVLLHDRYLYTLRITFKRNWDKCVWRTVPLWSTWLPKQPPTPTTAVQGRRRPTFCIGIFFIVCTPHILNSKTRQRRLTVEVFLSLRAGTAVRWYRTWKSMKGWTCFNLADHPLQRRQQRVKQTKQQQKRRQRVRWRPIRNNLSWKDWWKSSKRLKVICVWYQTVKTYWGITLGMVRPAKRKAIHWKPMVVVASVAVPKTPAVLPLCPLPPPPLPPLRRFQTNEGQRKAVTRRLRVVTTKPKMANWLKISFKVYLIQKEKKPLGQKVEGVAVQGRVQGRAVQGAAKPKKNRNNKNE